MAEALIILSICCLSSSCSSVASSVGYFGGFIPKTAPHFLEHMDASDIKKAYSTDPLPFPCIEVDGDDIADKIAEYESDKVFSLFDFKSLEKEEVLNTYLGGGEIWKNSGVRCGPGLTLSPESGSVHLGAPPPTTYTATANTSYSPTKWLINNQSPSTVVPKIYEVLQDGRRIPRGANPDGHTETVYYNTTEQKWDMVFLWDTQTNAGPSTA